MCDIRNKLAHERDQDIDFDALWALLLPTLDRTDAQLDRLEADGWQTPTASVDSAPEIGLETTLDEVRRS